MCGIVGYMALSGREEAVGETVLAMLDGLALRGPDSAGAAIFAAAEGSADVCWIRLPDGLDSDAAEETVLGRLEGTATIRSRASLPAVMRLELEGASADEVRAAVERADEDFEVVSFGPSMELVKQVGHPDDLDRKFDLAARRGRHGIGHTRMSTESRVDLSHSQPFWTRGIPDMATVHNGHITNYHKLRTHYEQRGVRFFTENDSEVIGVYLADKLSEGLTLEQALEASLDDFDGSFTYFVATADAIGYARDRYALKPLIVLETPDYIAIANEEVAIRGALGSDGVAYEPAGHVHRVWRRTPAATEAAIA